MKRHSKRPGGPATSPPPEADVKEIPMTDLGWSEDDEDRAARPHQDIHAAGTPGGGAASGGLAGTNKGDSDPDNVDLENAAGSGIYDTDEEQGHAPFSGEAGGAVGGTPAEKRVSGGRQHHGLAPGGMHRGDSTIGSKTTKRKNKREGGRA